MKQVKYKTNKFPLFLCQQLAFLSEKLILWNKYVVQAQVLAFLSILQASKGGQGQGGAEGEENVLL